MPIHDWTRVEAGIFHHFHHVWIDEIQRALNKGLLPADYYALAEQKASGIGPDVLTLHGPGDQTGAPGPSGDHAGGGLAVATAPPKVEFRSRMTDERYYSLKAKRVVVRHVSGHRVVAVVEIVSPGNKSDRGAFQDFVQKASDLIASGVHLLVVDVFPPTDRDPTGVHDAIWGPGDNPVVRRPGKDLTCASYMAARFAEAFVQTMGLGDRLPEMPVFLSAERYVLIPLEQTYESAWDSVPRFWREQIAGGA